MKLQQLHEEKIEVKKPEDIWSEGDTKTYIGNTVYSIKKNDDGSYQVTIEGDSKRKVIKKSVTKEYVDENFVKLTKSSSADVEGYSRYRSSAEQEAMKYDGDTVKLDMPGKPSLKKTNYLVRKESGDEFTYEVKKQEDFEADWEAKK